jgi:hypothetical protein
MSFALGVPGFRQIRSENAPSHILSVVTKTYAAIGREKRDVEGKEWSGLSESNRHLNLGKVPYYHYTKAA